ncbi:hypothetical protein LTS18_005828 [Coniosporium uncinatum]|uniref:Uncharacterized protein n=1 Tax=Coniosporium uncinatum TaxID=93489 RepID=A0ACC3DZE4_9PEZI|nr:hypothetical protein LTS18_005828 [Coniosporium uncinatum]
MLQQAVKDAKERTPDAAAEAEMIDFGTFSADDLEETIKKHVCTLRAAKLLQGVNDLVLRLTTETGPVEQVEV